MKILNDIFSSITGSAKTRVNDPFIGAFFCSWTICNWNYLSLLFLGEGKVTERVGGFYRYLSKTPVLEWNYILTIPLSITLFYLFVFPWISLLAKFFQHWANEKLHAQAVGYELIKISQQKDLNKEKLRANPNKQFLEQLVQQEIDKKKEILKHIQQRTARLNISIFDANQKAKEQEAKTKEAENTTHISTLELEKKSNQAELERIRFESNIAIASSTRASHRFPSAYYLMLKIDGSLREDNINISLNSLGGIIAAIFGYSDIDEVLNDERFNNEVVGEVNYIYYDDELAKRLDFVVQDESLDNDLFSASDIFNHLEYLFEDIPFELVTGEVLAEKCKEAFENNPYDIFDCEGTSQSMAESDTVFESIDDVHIKHFDYDDGFYTELTVSTSGEHYKESGVPGRSMTVSVKMQCDVLVGKYGLGSIKLGEVKGTLDNYD